MPKTFLTVNVVLSGNEDSAARTIKEFRALAKQGGHSEFGYTLSQHEGSVSHAALEISHGGPRIDRGPVPAGDGQRSERAGRAEAAAAEFDGAEGRQPDPEPAAEPKRRGRPRKSDEPAAGSGAGEAGSGSAEGGRNGTGGSRRSGQDAGGNEPVRTDEGAREGRGEGEGRRRSTGGRGEADGGDRRADRVATPAAAEDWDSGSGADEWDGAAPENKTPGLNDEEGEDWWAKTPGDEWPDSLTPEEITKDTLAGLMSEHLRSHGGKAKSVTFRLLQDVTKRDSLSEVHEDDYDFLARVLLKDAARYRHGIKPQKKGK